ncbi:MAG: major capsid protein [Microvirus sp.]|nr:MAG: major capsid protein [Microvirus sp.]
MYQSKSVDVHQFAMVPKAEIPRSAFLIQRGLKTTFDAGYLVPIFVADVLPGDTFRLQMTAFTRLATPLYPVMDNLHLDTFFFFVPNRLVWTNWVKMMGEQDNPADSISYSIPQQVCPAGGYAVNSLQDYFTLPTVGQVGGGNTVTHSALPLRMYNLIYNQWFRDENLQNSVTVDTGNGPDTVANYTLLRRGKRFDYFTGCLPNPQKGGSTVTIPLSGTAPIMGLYVNNANTSAIGANVAAYESASGVNSISSTVFLGSKSAAATAPATAFASGTTSVFADLSLATGATINALRLAFQTQRLLERDARGGTRYTEIIRAHFGVMSPDSRLQRPEYLGGGSTPITINPIAQTTQTGLTGGSTPLGTLGGMGTGLARGHGFSSSFVEHGYIIGLCNVRADLNYQQGLDRHWSRSTRYDFYFPVFAQLGEQSVLNKEIYCDGSGNDASVFGYQERWAEYRYMPNKVTGLFKSTSSGTIDGWHLAQKFTALPTLNTTFIQDTPPVSRVVAVGASANGQQILMDAVFDIHAARPMPLYSVPGLIDHF